MVFTHYNNKVVINANLQWYTEPGNFSDCVHHHNNTFRLRMNERKCLGSTGPVPRLLLLVRYAYTILFDLNPPTNQSVIFKWTSSIQITFTVPR